MSTDQQSASRKVDVALEADLRAAMGSVSDLEAYLDSAAENVSNLRVERDRAEDVWRRAETAVVLMTEAINSYEKDSTTVDGLVSAVKGACTAIFLGFRSERCPVRSNWLEQ